MQFIVWTYVSIGLSMETILFFCKTITNIQLDFNLEQKTK